MLSYIQRHLGLKLFLSYLIVILVSMIVLATTAEFVMPSAFDRHLAAMSMQLGTSNELEEDLFNNFRSAVTEAMSVSALAALFMAVLVSFLVSRQVVAPVREMMTASQRIAEGHYDQRVNISGDVSKNEQDELGELALSFNQMASRLDQMEAIRRQLIADISHELRTPLTIIKGSMEGLMDGVLPPSLETFQQVYSEADRLQRLVSNLQELSQVEAGAYELNLSQLSLTELTENIVVRLNRQFEEKGVTLETDVVDSLPTVKADVDRLGQVMINLLGNALQYTPEGGRVRVSAYRVENEVNIAITDNGVGIPADHLPHIFTRFYRVDKSRSRVGGGSGIGLTIAKHLVEAHGGRICADSPGPGQGSTFTFSLPIAS